MSKERGIIFQGWGVRAIRNMKPGVWPAKAIDPAMPIKPMTRRTRNLDEVNERPDDWRFQGWSSLKEGVAVFADMAASKPTQIEIKCPYGIPSAGLWVRETWWPAYRRTDYNNGCVYRADYLKPTDLDPGVYYQKTWTPSIFMFRWASREDLIVKDVRVERVQDISEEDARAEGATSSCPSDPDQKKAIWAHGSDVWYADARSSFAACWNEINKARGFGWEANPWIWVVSYMRI